MQGYIFCTAFPIVIARKPDVMSAAPDSSIRPCCVSGHLHSGTPLGAFESLHGLRTYVSKPPGASKLKTLILLPEIFGVDLVNTQLVADEWAKNDFYVYLPDIFNGDAIDVKHLKTLIPNLRDQEKAAADPQAEASAESEELYDTWSERHREEIVKPIIEKFLQGVRSDPETGSMAGIGFCFGGRYVFVFGQRDSSVKFDAVVAYHPTAVVVPADVETVDVPSAILIGDRDDVMSVEEAQQAFQSLRKSSGDKAYLKVYPETVHSFAIRGDDMVESEKKNKEDALREGVQFLNQTLAA